MTGGRPWRLIALGGDKGSPGATTAALAMAATWPGPVVLVEADPCGGDLALRLTDRRGRFDLADQPNLLTFAAATRRGHRADLLGRHAQTTTGGLRVVRGLASAAQATGMDRLWPAAADALGEAAAGDGAPDTPPGGDVLVDLGRLWPGSPATPVAAAADLTVVVGAGTTEGLVHLRERVHALTPLGIRLGVVLVAGGSAAVELVLVAPLLVALLLFVAGLGRIASARGQVDGAARDAARAASLERAPAAARSAAQEAARAALAGRDITCARMAVTVGTTAFRPGGQVSTRVSCTVGLADLGLTGFPGHRTLTGAAIAPLEAWRSQ
jgi:hypothetical protein